MKSNSQKTKYAAFLRGINVGGKKVSMADLKKVLETFGFSDVKTLLNSGNAVFSAPKTKPEKLVSLIEEQLEKKFKFSIDVVVRSQEEIEEMIESDPFKKIAVTKDTRLYVTLFGPEVELSKESKLKIPYTSPSKEFRILKLDGENLYSVLVLTPDLRTPDAMNIIEKEFGKKRMTTRNWNTIEKVLKAMIS